jgi:signal transduction histidine kinase/ActR/RegA family two-component response regulator
MNWSVLKAQMDTSPQSSEKPHEPQPSVGSTDPGLHALDDLADAIEFVRQRTTTEIPRALAEIHSSSSNFHSAQAKAVSETESQLRQLSDEVSRVQQALSSVKQCYQQSLEKAEQLARSQAEAIVNAAMIMSELHDAQEELHAAKAQADAANQAKSAFLANMSHEIRTPMTAILGFAEALEENMVRPENMETISIIRRNGSYLISIINDILDLSKIEAGKMEIERVACNPAQVIAEVSSLMRVRTDAKGIRFDIEYQGDIPETIFSDPTRLRQILINLIGNAIKFTEDGSVRIVTRYSQDGQSPCLNFDIIDTGRGIPEEQIDGLFEPFAQADTSTTREFGGTGLGLTISKRFAVMLGGDIAVIRSESGVGTTFRVSVSTGNIEGVKMIDDPLAATTVVETVSSTSPPAPYALGGLHILLAEDGPDNQRLLSFILKNAGAEVTIQNNGQRALDAALAARDAGTPFDCILMDMQMPVLDGYSATRQLRAKNYTGTIIALTAHAMMSDREKCINVGCDDYASKPVDRNKLVAMISRHAERSSEAA